MLIDSLDRAIEQFAPLIQGAEGPAALERLRKRDYANQLAPADACLNSFLAYEVDPSNSDPVGGEGKSSIGGLVGDGGDKAQELRGAVATTVTLGYVSHLSVDAAGFEFVGGRSAEALWQFWVGNMRPTATIAFGLPSGFVAGVRQEAGEYLVAQVDRLGLMPGILRRRALAERAGNLGIFGIILRLGQTNAASVEDFEEVRAADQVSRWPFVGSS